MFKSSHGAGPCGARAVVEYAHLISWLSVVRATESGWFCFCCMLSCFFFDLYCVYVSIFVIYIEFFSLLFVCQGHVRLTGFWYQ